MKTYLIKSHHTITKDDFKEGETDTVNWFDMESEIIAETPEKAVKKYLDTYVFAENTDFIKDEFAGWFVDNLVDADNMMPSKQDINLWKQGKKDLYNDYTTFEVYELKHINPIKS